jgi:hypothetical protein
MKFVKFLVDHSTAILALLTALFNLLAAFGLELSSEQVGAINTFAVALIAVLSEAFTTASSNVVSLVSGGQVQAGAAAAQTTGSEALVLPDAETQAPVSVVRVKAARLRAAA